MFTGCNALLPNEIRPVEALPISPRNPRGANVGYDNLALPNASRKTMGFVFKNVGNGNEKLMLTEIKVIGYRDTTYWKGRGAAPKIYLYKMNDAGGTEVTYTWSDTFDPFITQMWEGGYWKILGGATITEANDVEIPTAEGFYVECEALHEAPVTLQCNGEVLVGSYAKPFPNGSRKTLVNPMPVATTLTKLDVQGYRDSTYWKGRGAAPKIYLYKMNDAGGTEVTYTWSDTFDPFITQMWEGGYWKILGGAKITEDNDVEIGPGEGFYVECEALHEAPVTLTFPACLEAAK